MKPNEKVAQAVASRSVHWKTITELPEYSGVALRMRSNSGSLQMTPLDMHLNGYDRNVIAHEILKHG